MTEIDRKAYKDYIEMKGWKEGGLGYGEIAEIMQVSESYLISLVRHFN